MTPLQKHLLFINENLSKAKDLLDEKDDEKPIEIINKLIIENFNMYNKI